MDVSISLTNVSKSFGNNQVLKNFTATFPKGKVTAIMAPSGGGKTTLLRILMGLEQADSGTISGMEGLRLSAVFQEDRLCSNLSPSANIRLTSPEISKSEAAAALNAVGLDGCSHQPVRELSGGMRRRVAILRALMADYEILFLDEPFKGLDETTKELVIRDTKLRCANKTVLLVTHDEDEAVAMDACQILGL